VIIMISDGCGYNHVDAASLYQYGETGVQPYEQFPVMLGMTTYSADGHGYDGAQAWADFDYVNHGYTDSAAAATAMSTGAKAYDGAIGVGTDGEPLQHILVRAEALGKSTGVVTTMALSHATPAAFVAHNESRYNYAQIAQQMILTSTVDVIMGAGHPWYDNDGKKLRWPQSYRYVGDARLWNRLVAGTAGGDCDGDGVSDPWHLVETRAEFQALASGATPKRVIGVARAHETLQERRTDGRGSYDYGVPSPYRNDPPYFVPLNDGVPRLEEMTEAALNVLDDDPDGLFLMVEGGAVDYASHANESGRMIEEQIDFDRAVEAAIEWVEENSHWAETLLIVTADHETGYLTGPDSDPTWEPLVNNGAGNMPGMEWHSDLHTNSLVPIFAQGEAASLFRSYADETDPVHGPYIGNTDIAQLVFACMVRPHRLYLPTALESATQR
jgi:alkaline phosphatase